MNNDSSSKFAAIEPHPGLPRWKRVWLLGELTHNHPFFFFCSFCRLRGRKNKRKRSKEKEEEGLSGIVAKPISTGAGPDGVRFLRTWM